MRLPAPVGFVAPTLKVSVDREAGAVRNHMQLLNQCKHVDRTTSRMQCPAVLRIRAHKRGYLSVSCDAGHQWVWCAHCCDCSRSLGAAACQVSAAVSTPACSCKKRSLQLQGARGCIIPAHWFERDSFDTGKHNHMQRHLAVDASLDARAAAPGKQRVVGLDAAKPQHVFLNNSRTIMKVREMQSPL